MKKIFALFCVITVISLLSAVFVGCTSGKLPEYGFESPQYDYSFYDWRKLLSDEEITLDGVMDEDVWTNQSVLKCGDGDIKMNVTTYSGEKAVYIAVYVADEEIYSNPKRDDWRNTSIELHVASATATSRTKAVQLRIEADGRMGSLVGVDETFTNLDKAVISYGWDYDFVPFYAKVHVDGTLNTSECEGVGFEVMIPWSSLSMKGKGDILLLPAYNHTDGYDMEEGVNRKHIQASGAMNDVTSYQPFNQYGFSGYNEEEDDVLGASATGRLGTTGWDMSQKNQGIVKAIKGGQTFIFFKQAGLENNYTVTTKISDVYAFASPAKVGIICGMNSTAWVVAFLVFNSNGTTSMDIVEMDDYGWYYGQSVSVDVTSALTNTGVVFSMTRNGRTASLYVNDNYVMEVTTSFLDEPGTSGFFDIDAGATFSEYQYTLIED